MTDDTATPTAAPSPNPADGSWPRTTGQVAAELGARETQIADIVRRGHVRPPPPVIYGRRRWWPQHVRQLAAYLARVQRLQSRTRPAGDQQ